MNPTDTALTAAIAAVATVLGGGVATLLWRRLTRFGREALGYLSELSALPVIVVSLKKGITELDARVKLLEEMKETP